MFSKLFGRKPPNNLNDPMHSELHRTHAAIQAAIDGKLTEQQLLNVVLHLSLYVPLMEPLPENPSRPLKWKPVMVEIAGVFMQVAFSSLELAAEFERANPFCVHGRILKSEWLFRNLPEAVGLAINRHSKHTMLVTPKTVGMCRDFLREKNAS